MDLRLATGKDWVECVLDQFDAFLVDHASCERKASAVGLSFVVRYPDRPELIDPMILFAREELEHFHQVFRLISKRGLRLLPDEQDPYVNQMMEHVRFGREERFLDRLLVSGVIEARGTERLALVADHVKDLELQAFYTRLARAEQQHSHLFYKLALKFFPQAVVDDRLNYWLDLEANTLSRSALRPAVH